MLHANNVRLCTATSCACQHASSLQDCQFPSQQNKHVRAMHKAAFAEDRAVQCSRETGKMPTVHCEASQDQVWCRQVLQRWQQSQAAASRELGCAPPLASRSCLTAPRNIFLQDPWSCISQACINDNHRSLTFMAHASSPGAASHSTS